MVMRSGLGWSPCRGVGGLICGPQLSEGRGGEKGGGFTQGKPGSHLSPSQVDSWAAGGRAQEGRGDSTSWCFWKVTTARVCYKVFLDVS